MKIKTFLFIAFLLTSSASLFAHTLIDSIGVENLDGKKVILHKLDPKDNYFSVGRRYDVRPNVIIQFNNNIPLIDGKVIKVPTDRPFLEKTSPVVQKAPAQTAPAVNTASDPNIQQYKVSAGETLYSIAKRFSSTEEDIKKLNGLTSTALIAGQTIQVRSGVADIPPPVVPVVRPVAKPDVVTYSNPKDSINAVRFNANKFGLYEKNEKGVATWMDDDGLDASKKLVLHRTAPVGTVIKITNPMTGRTTFAKVVGRFNDSENTKDVILVMTKNVAESIGALDKRIHVNISYGSPNE